MNMEDEMEYRIIKKMVNAMEIDKDDYVLLNFWGEDEEIADLESFEKAFKEHNIKTLSIIHSQKTFVAASNEEWYNQFDEVTVVVDIMNKAPGMPPKGIEEEQIPKFVGYLQRMFGMFGEKKKFIQITMPTDTNAMLADMEPEQYKARVINALDIDYSELKSACQSKINELESTKRIIRTGENCVLTMETAGRKWLIDAGDGSLPCGEIYIPPVEDKTQGEIFFKTFSVEKLGVYKNVILKVENGKVIDSNCQEFNEFLKQLPEGGDVVSELGIGMNPNVKMIQGDSALDENALGTFHIAIGMNHLFGGENQCPIHFDFVTTGSIE